MSSDAISQLWALLRRVLLIKVAFSMKTLGTLVRDGKWTYVVVPVAGP